MKLLIAWYAYGILKVLDPSPEDPIYLLVNPECAVVDGPIEAYRTHVPTDSDPGPEGYLVQEEERCEIEQFVTSGP